MWSWNGYKDAESVAGYKREWDIGVEGLAVPVPEANVRGNFDFAGAGKKNKKNKNKTLQQVPQDMKGWQWSGSAAEEGAVCAALLKFEARLSLKW